MSRAPSRAAAGALLALLAFPGAAAAAEAPVAGVVSAATPEATAAGVEILEAGGNAADAAVAVAFALAVTEPAGSGLGGQAMALLHPPGGPAVVLAGSSLSPRATPTDASAAEISGHRASTVPSAVRVLDALWRRHGSGGISWAQLLAPAIRAAEAGYVPGPFRRHSLARYARALRRHPATAEAFLGAGGALPPAGATLRQPALARTLRRLADAGADDFYRGQIARAIARDMAEGGGWISLGDLETFPEPAEIPALRGSYRGWDVYTLPPPAGGWVVLQALNVLEHAPRGALAARSEERAIWMAEALRASHGSRAERPVRNLVEFEQAVRRRTGKEAARELLQEIDAPGRGETTHFSVVDAEGFALGVSLSLNSYFGARVLSPELGFLYNDYMREFELESPEHPFSLRPAAMPYSSMSATALARDGAGRLVLGSPGSRRIISAVVQVVSYWVDAGLAVQQAVAAPRIHVIPEDDDLLFEARPEARSLLLALELRGFSVSVPLSSLFRGDRNPYFGGVHAVALEPSGRWSGAADPRRDGAARTAATRPRAADAPARAREASDSATRAAARPGPSR